MTTVRCNWCMAVSKETDLPIELDQEHCPECGRGNCLMDMESQNV